MRLHLFVNWLSSKKGVIVKKMTSADIAGRNKGLDPATVFYNAKPTSGIRRMHHIKVINSHAKVFTLSKDSLALAL